LYAFDAPPATLDVVKGWTFDSSDDGFTAAMPSGSVDPGGLGVDSGTPTEWARGNDVRIDGSGAWRTVLEATRQPGYSSNADIRLVSPPVTIPTKGSQFLRFTEWYLFEGAYGSSETFEKPDVEISYDNGRSWVSLRSKIVGENPDSPDPTVTTLPLPSDAKGKSIRIGFRLRTDPGLEYPVGGGWAIDSVQVLNGVCAHIAGFSAASASVPMAPAKPAGNVAPAAAGGIVGAIQPVAGLSAAGALPDLDVPPSPASLAAGTCRCGALRFQAATVAFGKRTSGTPSGGGSTGRPRGTTRRPGLPATGVGDPTTLALLALAVALALRRTLRRHIA
jgi:hypothetical protein